MFDKKFIIVSRLRDEHDSFNALGHEIHITRYILLDLLQKNKITNDYVIVTVNLERKILYENLFNNIIDWNEYKNKYEGKVEFLDLTYYSESGTAAYKIYDKFEQMNYSHWNFERSEAFLNLCNNIKYIDLNQKYSNIINNKFIVIHVRFNMNIDMLKRLINSIRNITDIKIIIFTVKNINNILNNFNNIVKIENLNEYVSFLKNDNCELLISEWSGGGQLSHYAGRENLKIYYYFLSHQSPYYINILDDLLSTSNEYNNIFKSWDFKTSKKINIKLYLNLDETIKNINNIILN